MAQLAHDDMQERRIRKSPYMAVLAVLMDSRSGGQGIQHVGGDSEAGSEIEELARGLPRALITPCPGAHRERQSHAARVPT